MFRNHGLMEFVVDSVSGIPVSYISLLLLMTSCTGSVPPLVMTCNNSSVEERDLTANPPTKEIEGWGRVLVKIESEGINTFVTYREIIVFSGPMEMGTEIYISDVERLSDHSRYPVTAHRLLINRHTGDGYFQTLDYKRPDDNPVTVTEYLENCTQIDKRF